MSVLSRQQIWRLRQAGAAWCDEKWFEAICASHEALRAAVAEWVAADSVIYHGHTFVDMAERDKLRAYGRLNAAKAVLRALAGEA